MRRWIKTAPHHFGGKGWSAYYLTPIGDAHLKGQIMTDTINIIAALLTIGFGLFGFLAPSYTASALDLAPTKSTMGLSEMRASVGGLFVVAGIAALWLNHPMAFAMIGFAFAGAALGRVVSLALDNPPVAKVLLFGGIEAALALWLILANLPRSAQ
jgi:hypothetical protein